MKRLKPQASYIPVVRDAQEIRALAEVEEIELHEDAPRVTPPRTKNLQAPTQEEARFLDRPGIRNNLIAISVGLIAGFLIDKNLPGYSAGVVLTAFALGYLGGLVTTKLMSMVRRALARRTNFGKR